jgi:DNA-directed RNA polymerase specialized sigma subunit
MFTSFFVSGLSVTFYSDREVTPEPISLDEFASNDKFAEAPVPSFESPLVTFQDDSIPVRSTVLNNIDLLTMIQNVLTHRQFQVFQLRFIYDKDQIEIGKILGITQPSVNKIIKLAVRRLRKKLHGIDTLLDMN